MDLKYTFSEMALLSVGTNPRSLKRLINTLSLLNIIRTMDIEYSQSENYETLINFGLVCAQIAYPKLYSFLIQEPDYKSWNEQTAKKHRLPEINESQQALLEGTTEFDEMWEKVLFRLCVSDPYLSSRIFQISQFLNFLAQQIPEKEKASFGDEIQRILGFSAVTSVNLETTSRKSTAAKFAKIRFKNWEEFEEEFKLNRRDAKYLGVVKLVHDYLMSEYADLIIPQYGTNTLTFNVVNKKTKGGTRVFLYNTFHKQHMLVHHARAKLFTESDFTDEVKTAIRNSFNNLSAIQK